jgi:hypothetical protein
MTSNPLQDALQQYHPLFIEGMGAYDTRDPQGVAQALVAAVRAHWQLKPPSKPVLVITQGDPPAPQGISAITRVIGDALDLSRGLCLLDPSIADYHARSADRYKSLFEVSYSDLCNELTFRHPGLVSQIETLIGKRITEKNAKRSEQQRPALADYCRDFALLQEVAKATCRAVCGEITLLHTSKEISEFSVTSFYEVGLDVGTIKPADVVSLANSVSV